MTSLTDSGASRTRWFSGFCRLLLHVAVCLALAGSIAPATAAEKKTPSKDAKDPKDAKKDDKKKEEEKVDLVPPGGSWKWTVATENSQTYTLSMKLKQEAGQWTGLHQFRNGFEAPMDQLSLQGDRISFRVSRMRDGQPMTLRYSGRMEGGTIRGKVDTEWNGETRTRDWLAQWQAPKPERGGGIAGHWKWTTTFRGGQAIEWRARLKKEADKVTGSLLGRGGREIPVSKGTIKDDDFSFEVHMEFQGRDFVSTYKGKVKGDKITGTIETPSRDGGTRSADWEAHREDEEAQVINVAGVWKWSVTANGQTFEPSVELTQDVDKIAGRYTWNGNHVDVSEGKLKDTEIQFNVVRERDGKKLVTRYRGRVDGDVIKGTVESDWDAADKKVDWEARRAKK